MLDTFYTKISLHGRRMRWLNYGGGMIKRLSNESLSSIDSVTYRRAETEYPISERYVCPAIVGLLEADIEGTLCMIQRIGIIYRIQKSSPSSSK